VDGRRLGLALVLALLISIVVTSVFYVRISKQQAANKPKMRQIVAVNADMQPGTPLTAENLKTIDWPEAVPLEGAIAKKEDAVGKVLFYGVQANEPLRERDFASANSSLGLAAKIPDGMRAVAIKVNEVNNVAGFLNPGSRVDVLLTAREENSNVTRTVLQNLQVLSVGKNIQPNPEGKPENVSVITVLASPEESQKLALAQSQGTVQFVLRNGGDAAKVEVKPFDAAQLGGAPAKASLDPNRPRKVVSKPKPEIYTVETVAGNKTSVTSFPEPK